MRFASAPAAVVALALGAPAAAQTEPPPTSAHFLQYGVGIGGESVADAADVCPESADAPCILGGGLGPSIRVGYRARGAWFVGGAYEFSSQDSSNLLRLAILQQLRGEARYYLGTGSRLTAWLGGGVGAALYGNEWGAETGGAVTSLAFGGELEVSRTTVIGASIAYRLLLLRRFTDSAHERRADGFVGFGMAHLIGVEVSVDGRSPLSRW